MFLQCKCVAESLDCKLEFAETIEKVFLCSELTRVKLSDCLVSLVDLSGECCLGGSQNLSGRVNESFRSAEASS